MEIKNKLKLKSRVIIYNYILNYPGLHRNELSRRINIPYTTLKYHLNHLIKRGVLVEKNDGKYIRYYVRHKIGEIDKNMINLFRRETVRNIIMYLDAIPDASLIEIATYWKKSPRTIAFYIKKLMEIGLIESAPKGREKNYRLAEWGEIYDLLITFNKVLFDDELSKYIKWRDAHTFGKVGTIDDFFEVIYEIFPHPYHV